VRGGVESGHAAVSNPRRAKNRRRGLS
jgi:hypothetical protein